MHIYLILLLTMLTNLQVDDHKTATSHGPARLVFNDEVYSLARVYADYGRVQTANVTSTLVLEDDSPFFLENKGGKVTRVAQTIFRLWKSHGFAGNLNPTHIRYTAATKVCYKYIQYIQITKSFS